MQTAKLLLRMKYQVAQKHR